MTRFVPTAVLLTLLVPGTAAAQWLLALEGNHSTVGFSVPIAGGLTRVTGVFKSAEVSIIWDEADVARWSLEVTIPVGSVDTNNDLRDADLRGTAFFDADRHPTLTFRSTKVEKRGDAYVAIGALSMRGVTRDVEIPFTITGVQWSDGRPLLGASIRWKVNRLDFGVGADWRHTVIPNFLGNEVAVEIDAWTRLGRKAGAPVP